MTSTTKQERAVAVEGGDLYVAVWPGRSADAPAVFAVHGITANHVSFEAFVEVLGGEATVVAPDLRGRGRSNGISGPFGITAHVADLVATLDDLGIGEVVAVGHSMGAWVVALAAVRHPGRVRAAVLVDGGLALPLPGASDIDEVLAAVLGPSLARLSMTFESPDAYRDFWRRHPALGAEHWNDLTDRYVTYDLVGEPPELRPSVSIVAVRGDAAEQLTDPDVRDAAQRMPCPATVLFAPRGLLDADPLYPVGVAEELAGRIPNLAACGAVAGTNHYTILLGQGATAVADAVRAHLTCE
jgi:pimeloyl-ACP methyl ester carboxylesterase